MSNLRIKTGTGADAYLSASGAGTDADPYVPVQELTPLEISSTVQLVNSAEAVTLVAAPAAGNRLVIDLISIFSEEATPVTVTLRDGVIGFLGARLANDGQGVTWSFERGKEIRLTAATALTVLCSAAVPVRVSVRYRTEAA